MLHGRLSMVMSIALSMSYICKYSFLHLHGVGHSFTIKLMNLSCLYKTSLVFIDAKSCVMVFRYPVSRSSFLFRLQDDTLFNSVSGTNHCAEGKIEYRDCNLNFLTV